MAAAAGAGSFRPTAPFQLVKRAFIVCVAPWYFPAMFVARQAKLLCGPPIKQPILFGASHFTSLPSVLQVDILKALPLVDRLQVCALSKDLSVLAAGPSPLWEELEIDNRVQSHQLQHYDKFEAWLSLRSAGTQVLVLKGLRIPVSGTFGPVPSGRLSTMLQNHLKASLKSLTITECGSAVGEMEFAAFAACQRLTCLSIDTTSQIHPGCVSSISSLTCLNHLGLSIAPGDRKSSANVTKYKGFPSGLLQLTAMTSLKLSGWTFVSALPPAAANWSNLNMLAITNCAVMTLEPSMHLLQKLHTLDLSLNCLGSLEGSEHTKALSGLSHLTCLKLSSNGFSTTPLGLSKLTALKRFHFAANLLESADTLSCVLGSLTGLTKLILQHCSLKAVPDGLAALSDLQWLCLSRNHLQAVPKNLPWRNLQVLHLRGNELSLVPCAALHQARQLVHLDCGDNFPLQVESKALQRTVINRLQKLRSLLIDKDGSPEVPNKVKWTSKSLETIAGLEGLFNEQCSELQFSN